MKIAMTMVVRDEAELLPYVVRYHLAEGVDAVHIVDHGSSDETPGLLAQLAARGLPISWRRSEGPFDQLALASELALEAAEAGADWVLTADGDEFWRVPGGLKTFLARWEGVDAVSLPVVNFVQWRWARTGSASLYTVATRPTSPIRKRAYERMPPDGRPPWVVRQPGNKSIARAGVLLGPGAHAPIDRAAVRVQSPEGACLHVPLRSRAKLAGKHRLEQISGPGDVESAWRANSWVVPTRLGPRRAPTPLTVDLRVVRIALRLGRRTRRDLRAARAGHPR